MTQSTSPPPDAPYTAIAVANFFIQQAIPAGGVQHLKLQKLVYCAYGWWLYFNQDGALLADASSQAGPLVSESPEAWQHGPVFSRLYSLLRVHGWGLIRETQSPSPLLDPPEIENPKHRRLLTWVWKRYEEFSGRDLSDLTHRPGTPWHQIVVNNGYPLPSHMRIEDQDILAEFSRVASSFELPEGTTRSSQQSSVHRAD